MLQVNWTRNKDARHPCDLLPHKIRAAFARRAQVSRPPKEDGSG